MAIETIEPATQTGGATALETTHLEPLYREDLRTGGQGSGSQERTFPVDPVDPVILSKIGCSAN
jgi:hypothetical protein